MRSTVAAFNSAFEVPVSAKNFVFNASLRPWNSGTGQRPWICVRDTILTQHCEHWNVGGVFFTVRTPLRVTSSIAEPHMRHVGWSVRNGASANVESRTTAAAPVINGTRSERSLGSASPAASTAASASAAASSRSESASASASTAPPPTVSSPLLDPSSDITALPSLSDATDPNTSSSGGNGLLVPVRSTAELASAVGSNAAVADGSGCGTSSATRSSGGSGAPSARSM